MKYGGDQAPAPPPPLEPAAAVIVGAVDAGPSALCSWNRADGIQGNRASGSSGSGGGGDSGGGKSSRDGSSDGIQGNRASGSSGSGGGGDSGGGKSSRDGSSIDLQQVEERQQQQREEQQQQRQNQNQSSVDNRSPAAGDGVPAAVLVEEQPENKDQKAAELKKNDGEAVAECLSTGGPQLQPRPQCPNGAEADKIDEDAARRREEQAEEPCEAHEEGEGGEREDEGGEDWNIESAADVGGKYDRGEEKREIGWAPNTNKVSPPPGTTTGALGAAAAVEALSIDPPGIQTAPSPPPPPPPVHAKDADARSKRHAHKRSLSLTRYPSLPLLSAGPYLSHKRGSSTAGSLMSSFRHELQQQQQQQQQQEQEQERALVSTPRATRGDGRATPSSRPRNRKTAPMLGMLQNAQGLAATSAPASASVDNNTHHRSSANATAATTGDAGAAADHSTIRRSASRSTSFGFVGLAGFGGWGGTSKVLTPVAVGASAKGAGRLPLTPLSLNRSVHFDHEEAAPLGAGDGGWSRVGRKRMREKASSFMLKLPGPKLLMQVLENEVDPKNVRLTTQSEPKILMEVMPAALVVSLLVLTYLVFTGCLVLIVRHNLRGTSTLGIMAPGGTSGPCTTNTNTNTTNTNTTSGSNVYMVGVDGPDPNSPSAAGCTVFSPEMSELSLDAPPSSSSLTASTASPGDADGDGARYGAVFSGHFSGMTTLYGSVSLHASFADDEAIESLPDPATVDLALEACTGGPTAVADAVADAVVEEAGEAGAVELEWGTCEDGWQPVLFQESISARIRSLPSDRGYTMFNFFQNQETIRGQALVRQYRVQVGFVSNNDSTSTSASGSGNTSAAAAESFSLLSEARWSLEYETGATEQWARIVLAIVLVCWVPAWLAWCWAVFCYKAPEGFKNALHERKWLAFMGLSVSLYLNPVMVVGNFVAPGSASWALASEMSLSVAVAGFLVVTLCIADGVGKDRVGGGAGGSLGFYAPKVVFGVLTLAVMLLVDLTTFPSLTGWARGSLLAVQSWPQAERHAFIWVASARVFMVVLWAVWMLCRIYISGCLLRKLPYVPNRYQQLSYRFFGLQAFLLGIVFVIFALWRLIDIIQDDLGGNTVAAEFMLFIKTRQDHLGSVSILCAYTWQLLLLFLPSWFKESKIFRDIAVRFVYFEEQVPFANHKRDRRAPGGGGGDDRASRGTTTPGDTPGACPGDVAREDEEDRPLFCVETAAWLLELASEAYNDPVGFENPNNYHFGVADFARVGFELVEHIHNVEHDTHCFILKDTPRGRLVVAFRGSVGTKHWMDNLRFLQTEFNMDHMMTKGREHEAPNVLGEDIDIQAAETLHGVVAHLASASEEEDEEKDGDGSDEYGEASNVAEREGWGPALATTDVTGGQTPLAAATLPSPAAPVPAAANGEAGYPPPPRVAPPRAVSPLTTPINESKLQVEVVAGGRDGGESGDGAAENRGGASIEVPAEDGSKRGEGSGYGVAGAGGCDAAANKAATGVELLLRRNEGGAVVGETTTAGQERTRADGDSGSSSSSSNSSNNNACTPEGYPAPPGMSGASPARASSATTAATSDLTHSGGGSSGAGGDGSDANEHQRKMNGSAGGSGGSGSGDSSRDSRKRTQPISPSGIRAILKGFSVLPWQFREPPRDGASWNFPHRARGAAVTKSTPDAANPTSTEEPALGSASATAGTAAVEELPGHDRAAAVDGSSGGVTGDDRGAAEEGSAANASAPSPARSRGFLGTRWSSSVGNLGTPRIVRSHSMNLVSDIEKGKGRWPLRRAGVAGTGTGSSSNSNSGESKRWSTPRELFGGGRVAPRRGAGGVGGRGSARPRRWRSASFDHAAILEAEEDEEAEGGREDYRGAWGAPWRMGGMGLGIPGAAGGGWRGGVQGTSPSVMEGLGRGFVRTKEDLVRGTEAGLDMAREAARRGLQAADDAAHVMGINRIPVLRQYLWGQVHTGFWNSYEAVRGEVHASVRKTVVDWLLSQDNPPDIKLYVTGHSMGGALATHCAMDLKLHTIDRIQARLGNFVRVRRTLLQRVMDSLPRRLQQRRGPYHQHQQHHQHHQQQQQQRNSTGGVEHEKGSSRDNREGGARKRGRHQPAPGPPSTPPHQPPLSSSNGGEVAAASSGADAGGSSGATPSSRAPLPTPPSGAPAEGRVFFADGDGGPAAESEAPLSAALVAGGSGGEEGGDTSLEATTVTGSSPTCSPAVGVVVGGVGGGDASAGGGGTILNKMATHLNSVASALDPRNLMSSPTLLRSYWGGGERDSGVHRGGGGLGEGEDGGGEAEEVSRGTIELHMVSFGAPRVGNSIYAARYDDVVPHSFRVVVDGDPVPGVPSWWYTHVGTKVLIDGRGRGSLIMDPSFVEKRFFVRSKRYVLSHLTEAYQAGLRGNLLQAVPPEFAKSLPAHWPFGIKADSDSSSDSDDDGCINPRSEQQQQQQQQQQEAEHEEADPDSGGEGALPSSAITARQDDMAQQAVDALNEAQGLLGPWQQPQQQLLPPPPPPPQEQTQAASTADPRTAVPGAPGGDAANPTTDGAGAGAGGSGGGSGSNRFAERVRRVLRLGK